MKSKLFAFLFKNKLLIGINLLGFYLFAKMAEDVIDKEYILVIDHWISMQIDTVHTPLFNVVMVALSDLYSVMGILLFSSVLMLFLAYKKWYTDLWFYFFCVMGAGTAFNAIKMIMQRLRPESEILSITSYSFPSGHAMMATAMAAAVYFIFVERVHSKSLHLLLSLFCITWIGMIAFSRIYLDVHWLSDVIAGMGLGLFWVTFIVLVKRLIHTV